MNDSIGWAFGSSLNPFRHYMMNNIGKTNDNFLDNIPNAEIFFAIEFIFMSHFSSLHHNIYITFSLICICCNFMLKMENGILFRKRQSVNILTVLIRFYRLKIYVICEYIKPISFYWIEKKNQNMTKKGWNGMQRERERLRERGKSAFIYSNVM